MRTLGLLMFVACWRVKLPGPQESGVDPRVARPRTACSAGDFQKGVQFVGRAVHRNQRPHLVFNQGRCYHQNSQLPQAMTRFKEFLRQEQGRPPDEGMSGRAELHSRNRN